MCSCISPNVNCLWLVGVTLIFDGTPQKIVQRCQITTPRWPNDISSAADNAKNGPIMPLDQSPHQTVSRCGCKVECNSKTSYQHGFQKLCSTSHYFLELTSEVNERFINGQQTETSVNHLIESTMIFCFINYFAWVLVTMQYVDWNPLFLVELSKWNLKMLYLKSSMFAPVCLREAEKRFAICYYSF